MRKIRTLLIVATLSIMLGCAMHQPTHHNIEQAMVRQALEMVVNSL